VSWFPTFLHLFALGTAGCMAAVPFRELGRYYFRFHATIALVLVALAVALGRPWEAFASGRTPDRLAAGGALAFAALILLENVLVRAVRNDLRRDALLLPVSLGAIFVALAALARAGYGAGGALLLALHLLSSAAVLGTSLVAMSTGHWYLANAKLSFDILIGLCRLFVGALAVKAVVSGVYVAARFETLWGLEDFDRLIVATRIVAGEGLAMALALMSLSCAKRKANQSATGILYVGVVFVLIGETISTYYTLGKGIPV
jgi:hypothetical protein